MCMWILQMKNNCFSQNYSIFYLDNFGVRLQDSIVGVRLQDSIGVSSKFV